LVCSFVSMQVWQYSGPSMTVGTVPCPTVALRVSLKCLAACETFNGPQFAENWILWKSLNRSNVTGRIARHWDTDWTASVDSNFVPRSEFYERHQMDSLTFSAYWHARHQILFSLCKEGGQQICWSHWGSPLSSSGQSSWLQIQRSGFDSRRYQLFWEVVGLERGPLSLVSTTEELLGRKSCGSGLEIREYGRRDSSRWPRDTLYPQMLALTSPKSSGRSVDIVRSRTEATEFFQYDSYWSP
jgi:hypothetical protein